MLGKKLTAIAAKPMLLAGSIAAMAAGMPAAQAHEVTYNVTQTYNQVVYDNSGGWDTTFTGSFTYDSHDNTVANLTGSLSQAMRAAMSMPTFLSLTNQKSSVYDAGLGGFLVSTFLLDNTNVFSNSGGVVDTTGWATGGTKEIVGNNNAYVTIFFNPNDPFGALTTAQTAKLAYGDCTTGSLMGMGMGAKTCMTGYINPSTGLQGGTMQGTFPITQTIAAVPEPETYAMFLAGLGLMGTIVRRRKAASAE